MLTKIYAILGVIGTFLLGFLRLRQVTKQRDEAVVEKKRADAWIERQEETREKDAEIDLQYKDLQAEAKEAIKNEKIPNHLRKPRSR